MEACFAEPVVVGQGGTEVADSHNDDAEVTGQTKRLADLLSELRTVVADAAHTVRSEEGQILANLGGVDVEPLGDHLRRDRARSLLLE